MDASAKRDFFISYTSHDQAWAEWIAWQLEAAGYTVIFQPWDFRPGSDFIHAMRDAVDQAERLVAVLSPAYLHSAFGEAEWRAFFEKDPLGTRGSLTLVRVAEVEPPSLLKTRVHIDLSAIDNADSAKAALLRGLTAGRAKPSQEPAFPAHTSDDRSRGAASPRYPGFAAPIWNVPPRNPQFTGRRSQLDTLRAAFGSPVSGLQVVAVVGAPGVGKTQLAVEYAYRYAVEYELVWWFPASTAAAIPPVFVSLAVELHLLPPSGAPTEQSADQQPIVGAVHDHLSRRSGWLLVFDDADPAELTPYLPAGGGGHVLITSRRPKWEHRVRSPLVVAPLDPEEAVQFLLGRTASHDETGATALAERLGWLPLALEQAAAYMSRSRKPIADYLALFERRALDLLNRDAPGDHPHSVGVTMELAIDQLAGSPAARELLTWCAFMAPENIPLSVLVDGKWVDLPTALRRTVADEIDLDDTIAILYGFSLVVPHDGMIDVHRLVQEVLIRNMPAPDRATWAERAVRLLLQAFPSSIEDLGKPECWPRCEELLPHVYSAAAAAEADGLETASAECVTLLRRLGSYLQHRGEYTDARGLFERALRLAERTHDRHALPVAQVLNALGFVQRLQSDAAAARRSHERALQIIESAPLVDNQEVGRTLNNLGRTLYDLRDPAGARVAFNRGLDISSAAFGPDHPEVASILNNLGRLSYDEGDFTAALTLHRRALAIKEAAADFGPNHPSVAVTLVHLSRVLLALHDLDHARDAVVRALQIQEAVLGTDHPDLVATLEELARVCEAMGDEPGASAARERARSIVITLRPGRHRLARSIDSV